MWFALILVFLVLGFLVSTYYRVEEIRQIRDYSRRDKSLDLTNVWRDVEQPRPCDE
jgi:hypothetical protein